MALCRPTPAQHLRRGDKHNIRHRAAYFDTARSRTIPRCRPRSAALSKLQYRPCSISAMPIRVASDKAFIRALAFSSVSSAGWSPSAITSPAPLIAPLVHEALHKLRPSRARRTWRVGMHGSPGRERHLCRNGFVGSGQTTVITLKEPGSRKPLDVVVDVLVVATEPVCELTH